MRYIIDFVNSISTEQISTYFNSIEATILRTFSTFDKTYLIETDSIPVNSDLVEYIVNDEENLVTPLEFPQTIEIKHNFNSMDSDPTASNITFSTQLEKDWWKNYVLFHPDFEEETVTIPRKGKNVSVYILDSGIKHDHPEFASTSIENIWSVTPNDYSDPHGHGTAIASVISGNTCGLSNADLKIVKIFRSDRGTLQSEMLSALDAVQDHADPNKISVVNCSWFIQRNEFIESKIQQLINRNILVVASAGNNGQTIDDVTPAAMNDVLTVGSYNEDLVPSDFSNYADTSEISYTANSVNSGPVNNWAPGEKIWAATTSGEYGYTAGTSMSAAIASMILAYRLSTYIDSTGYLYSMYGDRKILLHENSSASTIDPITRLYPLHIGTEGKANLLDLSDSKYSLAKNYMISLSRRSSESGISYPEITEITANRTWYVKAGLKNFVPLTAEFAPTAQKIELLESIPEYCEFSLTGALIVNQPSALSSEQNIFTESYEIKLRVTLDSGSVHSHTATIKVVGEDTQYDSLSEDHELTVYLQSEDGCLNGEITGGFNNCEDGDFPFGVTCTRSGCFNLGSYDCCYHNSGKLVELECACFSID